MRKENSIWQEQQEYIHVMKTSFRLTKLQPKARHLMSILQTVRLFGVAFDNNIEEWTPFDTQAGCAG